MKIIEGFKLRPLGKFFIVVGEGLQQVDFNKVVSLNSTAAFLWKSLENKEFEVEDVKRALLDEYEIDEETASRDAAAICVSWKEAGLISE